MLLSVVGSMPVNPAFRVNRLGKHEFKLIKSDPQIVSAEGELDFKNLASQEYQKCIDLQERCGLDLLSEGEVLRNDPFGSAYITYSSGFLKGVRKNDRGEIIVYNNIGWNGDGFLLDDFALCSGLSEKPIKINVPGPFSFGHRVRNEYYQDLEHLVFDYALSLNMELTTLVRAGCAHIQLDDPHATWDPTGWNAFGQKALETALTGLGNVTTYLHMCSGNAYDTNQPNHQYRLTPPYFDAILDSVELLPIDYVSLEYPFRFALQLTTDMFRGKKLMLGVADQNISPIEDVDVIARRINSCTPELIANDLILTPFCGVKHLTETQVHDLMSQIRRAKDVFSG